MTKKLLFIGNTRLGDAVMSTGLLNSLCIHYKAEATVVCGSVAKPIFKSFPNVIKVITLNKKKYSMHWFDVWKEVKKVKWDIVYDLRSTPIIWIISAKKRVVLSTRDSKVSHRIHRLSRIDPRENQPIPKVWISSADSSEAKLYLKSYKSPYIVIGPTANWPAKIWSVNKFAKLITNIMKYENFKGGTIVLVGGPGEEKIGKDLEKLVNNIKIVNLIGRPVMPTAAVFALSDVFIGNDSGLMHLSAATGIPTLGLFGPTDDKLYSPSGKKCKVVRTPESPTLLMSSPSFDHRTSGSLMNSLTVEMVEKALKNLLNIGSI
tara:strand:- start:187 stop:1143 length:957 start_codon:yes stop_codon:yes gene_type:complete